MSDFYGPWSFELSTLEVHDKDGDLVVDVDSGDFMKEKSAELGQLIAAAPDLLDALQKVMSAFVAEEVDMTDREETAYSLARCAIYKALGEKA